jgi:hypothetical protein
MTEKQLQRAVTDALTLFGWTWHHAWTSVHSPAGYPDLTAVRGTRLVYCELKSATGTVTPAQQGWLHALGGVTQRPDVYLWRPEDLDEALEVLR